MIYNAIFNQTPLAESSTHQSSPMAAVGFILISASFIIFAVGMTCLPRFFFNTELPHLSTRPSLSCFRAGCEHYNHPRRLV